MDKTNHSRIYYYRLPKAYNIAIYNVVIIGFMKNKKTILIPVVFILTAIMLNWVHLLKSDEGVVLNAAWKIFHDQRLYVDFFEYVAPGAFYLVFLIFKIFGPSYLAVQIFSIVFLLVTNFFIYKIYLHFSENKSHAVFVSFIWLLMSSTSYPLINHNTYSTFLTIIVLYFVLKFLQTQRNLFVFGAGLFSAITIYFLQTKGILITLALLTFIVLGIYKRKIDLNNFFVYILGLTPVFALGLWLWGAHPFSSLFSAALPYIAVNKISYLTFAAFFIIALLPFIFLKVPEAKRDKLRLLLFFQLALYLSIINRPDSYHLLLNSFPLIIYLMLFNEENIYEFLKKSYSKKLLLIAGIVIYAALVVKASAQYRFHSETKDFLADLSRLAGEEEIFSHPFLPGLYFELKKQNPYYTSVVETIQGSNEMLKKNLSTLQEQNPKYVVTNYAIVKIFDYKKNAIDVYIEKNYTKVKSYKNGADVWYNQRQ